MGVDSGAGDKGGAMSDKSSIEWTDATWNPVRGCSRISEGCRNCYAERQAARFCKSGQPFHGFAQVTAPRDHMDRVGGRRNGWTGRVELIPEKLDEPTRWRNPRRIFVNSMSDLFHEKLDDEAINAVFGTMAVSPRHTFQILTKRPARMREYLSDRYRHDKIAATWNWGDYNRRGADSRTAGLWPLPNVWLGVSVEDQATADERIPLLLQAPAAVRFVSYEPALGPVDFDPWVFNRRRAIRAAMNGPMALNEYQADAVIAQPLDWLIVGGESGPGARPFDVAWARSAVAQCKAAGVPVFVKQLGAWPFSMSGDFWPDGTRFVDGSPTVGVKFRDRKGGDPSEWPEDLRVREFPEARP